MTPTKPHYPGGLMARYPAKKEKTIIIREINADTFTSPLDYWLETNMLRRRCDELHTIWTAPAPTSEEN
jgi:hypothetical protein